MSVLDDLLSDELFAQASRCQRSIVYYPARRRYTRRRARRQAFYARQRIERTLGAILRDSIKVHGEAYEAAMRSCITTGTGWLEVLWDRGDGEGFTTRPIEPGEWPKAMLRTGSIEP